jgi:TP901 family phage tail tape measure protein
MTAALKGFNISADDSVSVVDKWVNVSKNFAVTSKDLANAVKVAGASANQLGISISDFLGNITAVVEVTRKSGEEAARGLSFIYARLLTTGKSTIEQVAKIPFYLDAVGNTSNEITPKMRNISDILTDLASKWGTLTTKEQLEIATSLGSKRQMQVLYGLMQNYNASLDARITALTSAGSAEKAFQLVQDTTTYKLQQVGTAWNAFTNALLNTQGFKDTLSFFDQIIIGLTTLVSYEKGYAVLLAKENNIAMLATDTRLSEIKSLNELIEVRDKLNKLTKTPENENRLNIVNEAIKSIVNKEENVGLKVALDIGNVDLVKQVKEKLINDLTKEKIRLNVSLEYEPQIKALQNEIGKMRNNPISFTMGMVRGDFADKEKQIAELQSKQTAEIEKQYKIQLGQSTAKKLLLDGMGDENSLSGELTDKEKEKLDIQYKINDAKLSGLYNSVQLLDYEIALVTNSRYIYEEHDKNLKLYDLEKQKISEVNKLVKEQSDILQKSVSDTILAWEKGGTTLLSGFQSIGDTIRNSMMTSVAEGLSTNIMNSTGIGQMFGMMNVNLKDFTSGQGGIAGGIENGAYKGTYKGVKDALALSGANKAVWTGGMGNTGGVGGGWTLPGFGQGGWFNQPIGGNQYAEINGGATSALVAPANYYKNQNQVNRSQVYGGVAMSALTGYSAYQSAGGGSNGIGSGIMAGAGSLALLGATMGFGGAAATATTAAGALVAMPWLLPVLGIALLMGSQMFNSKTQTSTTTSTQENAISSKISVSNKQLELVNRNLIALRTDIRSYILPSSAYFSAKSGNIEDEYSIMSRAGYSG